MQVQVNTGNGVQGTEGLDRWASAYLGEQLSRFADEVTRVEVQLTDENHGKGANDLRCMLEARLNGHSPVAVNHDGENMDVALRGATKKLVSALDHAYGKLDRSEHRHRETVRKDTSPE